MTPRSYFSVVAASLAVGLLATGPSRAAEDNSKRKAEMEDATRLQVFLDRAEFAPGKIDGRHGEFTKKALALYRQAHKGSTASAAAPAAGESKSESKLDVSGLDLASIEPLFIDYTVTEDDLKDIGKVPKEVPDQAKLKFLSYEDGAEVIAEKFHTDVDFLAELNPGKTKEIKAGDTLRVPNVQPFELAAVKDLKPGSQVAANDPDDGSEPATKADGDKSKKPSKDAAKKEDDAKSPSIAVKIDTKTSMLSVFAADKLIAAYPVTIGSDETASPVGEWKVKGVAKMPDFRYDKAMLKKGERSDDFHMLPPGPNNPVGIVWIALNKPGIGLHGTSDPDSIGRSASHGCVRLANWDVVRLAAKVKGGVPVSIK